MVKLLSLLMSACFAVLLGAGLAAPCLASTGLQILVQPWDPHTPSAQVASSVFDQPTFFDDQLNAAWTLARSPICNQLTTDLGKSNLLGAGYTLYDIDCTMGSSGSFVVHSVKNGQVWAEFDVGGNTIEATTTQPSVCGSECDPRFSITYNLALDVNFTLIPLQVDTAQATVTLTNIDSKNLAGDVLKAVVGFSGSSFLKLAGKSVTTTQKLDPSILNNLLALASKNQVSQLASQYAYNNVSFHNARLIVDFAPVFAATPGPGSINGTITWTKASQIHIADCSKITLSDTVQTGPPQLTFPYNTFGSPPTASAGSISIGGPPADLGDRYACSYSISNLALNLPSTVTAQASGSVGNATAQPKTVLYFQVIRALPAGWSGTTLVSGAQTGDDFALVTQQGNLTVMNARTPALPVNPSDPGYRPIYVDPNLLAVSSRSAAAQRGVNAFRSGDVSGALTNFNVALAQKPDDYVTLYNRGLANLRLGNTSAGLADLRQAGAIARSKGDVALAAKADMAIRQFGAGAQGNQLH
jgi:hypothetical protein